MKTIKKSVRYLLRFLAGLIIFVLTYIFFSWLMPFVKFSEAAETPEKGVAIYIQSNGVHTDFTLPVRYGNLNWSRMLPYSDFEIADSTFNYISLGWGDKGFFLDTPTWADLKFSTAFNAAFGLGSTAMHVAYKRYQPKEGERCKKLILSEEQYRRLILYILSSFKMESKKPMLINHSGYTSYDKFYEANGSYSMFKTCNVWTGSGLQSIKVKIGIWTPFQGGIIEHLNEE
ncbi:MAG TPA: TIGR02117 family protein [Bacteroidia bacterium]|jgi:uncharacterized protein (TIGR02117 family)